MRPLEIGLLILIFISIVEPVLSFHKPRWVAYLSAAAVIVALAQVLVEGYRWQMLPVYVLAVAIFALNAKRMIRPPSESSRVQPRTIVGAVIGLILSVVVALPPILFPVPVLPTPTGAYKIGTVTYDWVDSSRSEIYSKNPADKREVVVQIWYPALPASNAPTAPWMDRMDVTAPVMARYIHLPDFMLDHLSLTRTNSYFDAPISNQAARYPVVVYSHGWNGFIGVNTKPVQSAPRRA